MGRLVRAVVIAVIYLGGLPRIAQSQTVRGVVFDQTGLPLPGATVQLLDDAVVVTSITTGPDGSFELASALRGATVVVSLDGFETATVPRVEATRIVLVIGRATESTEVVAPALTPASPSATLLGTNLTPATVARLPSARLKARESLPLLPSVVRGADGLLQMGGARPHETPLLIDGFDVTDPATGTSSINLPFETVQGVEYLRDPMAVTYGGLLGGLVQIETKPGGDSVIGVQGFIPRPRLTNPGLGRIEGIFPRVYSGGAIVRDRVRYFVAAEYDFERIPVPEVTRGNGPNIVEKSASAFGRVDIQTSTRSELIVEGLVFPSATKAFGLSPRRVTFASPDISNQDLFAGVTSRHVFGERDVFTIKIGVLSHETKLSPTGSGPAYLSPSRWRGNWFAFVDRRATRYSAAATWERLFAGGRHDVTVTGGTVLRKIRGTVSETGVIVEDDEGRVVRTVGFGAASAISATDRPHGVAVRDIWRASDRLQVDGGTRLDHNARQGGFAPSGRVGVRYAFDRAGLTVLKAGVGQFVGSVPLGVQAFSAYPTRIDRDFDEVTGARITEAVFQPIIDRPRLPRAVATTLQIERELLPGLDAQAGFTNRRATRLATMDVPSHSGSLAVRSTGTSSYRELQVSMRRSWTNDQQAFVSYVRSSSRGELNDFSALVGVLDTPLVQPGGRSRLSADARNRWIAWGTFNLPRSVVVSPVMEWHSGFPYSNVDRRHRYAGPPNGFAFPAFMAIDLVAYKKFTVRKRSADLGIQLFNVTNHSNPRDVYSVVGGWRFGEFTNSVGPILRGFMLIKW